MKRYKVSCIVFAYLICTVPNFLVAQEQIIFSGLSIGELRSEQTLDLEISYSASNFEKLPGLGLRLHFDSSSVDLGQISYKLVESSLPFQIKNDVGDLDSDSKTDKFLLTAWADTSGLGWPYNSEQPAILYIVPVTSKQNFEGTAFAE